MRGINGGALGRAAPIAVTGRRPRYVLVAAARAPGGAAGSETGVGDSVNAAAVGLRDPWGPGEGAERAGPRPCERGGPGRRPDRGGGRSRNERMEGRQRGEVVRARRCGLGAAPGPARPGLHWGGSPAPSLPVHRQ